MSTNQSLSLAPVNFINATGTTPQAFYGSVQCNMRYCCPCPEVAAADPNAGGPYLTVSLAPLKGQDHQARLLILIQQLLRQLILEHPVERVLVIMGEWNRGAEPWRHLVAKLIAQRWPGIGESGIDFVPYLDVTSLAVSCESLLLLAVDSLVDRVSLRRMNGKIPVQRLHGGLGVVPGEGAVSLWLPGGHRQPGVAGYRLQGFVGSLCRQLADAGISDNDRVILAGPLSTPWLKHWYGLSNPLYQRAPERGLDIQEMSPITGYLGATTLPMAIALAAAHLSHPLDRLSRVFILAHDVRQHGQLYRLTKTAAPHEEPLSDMSGGSL